MIRLKQLAVDIEAELRCLEISDGEVEGVASVANAGPASLVFAEDAASFAAAMASPAAAVLVPDWLTGEAQGQKPLLVHAQPRLAFARAARVLRGLEQPAGLHATAVVSDTALLGEGVSAGAYAVIEGHATIGAGSAIGSGAILGAGVSIGRGCRIYPRVVVYPGVTLGDRVVVHAGAVLGADGFGYVRDAVSGEYTQFPQQGTLVIEDDVEIGANSTVDRGALDETRIGRGTKIDNLVHVGHNVAIGRNVVLASQTGISGSTKIGDGAILGGQVGVGDHAEVGAGVILGGQAGVLPHKSLEGAGMLFWGTPAKPVKTYLRELATLARLVRRHGLTHKPGEDS